MYTSNPETFYASSFESVMASLREAGFQPIAISRLADGDMVAYKEDKTRYAYFDLADGISSVTITTSDPSQELLKVYLVPSDVASEDFDSYCVF